MHNMPKAPAMHARTGNMMVLRSAVPSVRGGGTASTVMVGLVSWLGGGNSCQVDELD